ncbi:hypothetical protein UFOVP586_48 [uncultured Caudovirales phage]|uniref:Uncharacterized protein n=1 Tax=uncultured Caudovirales phage TaxID=2100421 RepID=A0A6J5N448_9CAUD|nr:hypothetical protein UFOVP586_48 [uncultured Caudovirales phage]
MNERLKELAKQAKPSPNLIWEDAELESFAELVRQDEREACAALCTEMGNKQSNQCFYDPWDCASSIRARGNHEQD